MTLGFHSSRIYNLVTLVVAFLSFTTFYTALTLSVDQVSEGQVSFLVVNLYNWRNSVITYY